MDIEKYQKQHMEILDEIQILRKLIADGLDTKAEEGRKKPLSISRCQ